MDFVIERLSEKNLHMIDSFSCVESDDELNKYNSKLRKRIQKHSKEMDDFIKNEAYDEQQKGLNTTHLFINPSTNELIAYVSLCTDSLILDFDEKNEMNLSYSSVPAIKIARLAVSSKHKNKGIGSYLIMFSAFQCFEMRKYCGVAFMTLDCYEHRESFYIKNGFTENKIQPIELEYDSPISMRVNLDEYITNIINKQD